MIVRNGEGILKRMINSRNPTNYNDYNVPAPRLITRGYTGHEHLDGFGLINMNGWMYDPVIGRVLSPDAYVQAPGCTQSYNRYSYCMNNPLRYTDPSGYNEHPADWGMEAYINYAAFDVGFRGPMGTRGSGSISGGSYTYNWTTGEYMLNGNVVPFSEVHNKYVLPNSQRFTGLLAQEVFKQIQTAINSNILGAWHKGTEKDSKGAYTTFEGVPIISSSLITKNSAFTIPGVGIFVNPSFAGDKNLLRHEYGHILQAERWGMDYYYFTVGPTSKRSFDNYLKTPGFSHDDTWTEWSASRMAYEYFGRPSDWDKEYYPLAPVHYRSDSWSPDANGPFDFLYNWVLGDNH